MGKHYPKAVVTNRHAIAPVPCKNITRSDVMEYNRNYIHYFCYSMFRQEHALNGEMQEDTLETVQRRRQHSTTSQASRPDRNECFLKTDVLSVEV